MYLGLNSWPNLKLRIVHINFNLKKITLNPTKSEAKTLKIIWNNKDQPINYLGVFLDEKLTWKTHTNNKSNQAYARMKSLNHLTNHSSTLQIECSLPTSTSIIWPLIAYACPVWAAVSLAKIIAQNSLESIMVHA